jgi:putative radical SAM enzyme (TIGR03279 family)
VVIIKNIKPGSIAEELRIPAGSKLISINGNAVGDAIDFIYHSAEADLELLIEKPDGEQVIYDIECGPEDDLGLDIGRDKIRCCGNKCIFCFIDQLPPGLRPSLYIKDEDYRLSFLDGNFITLTSISRPEMERIVNYNLSPLYVSVHATDPALRNMMLGRKNLKPIMERLRFLTEAGIDIHAQIVLCPGINDGSALEKTIEDLASLRPHLRSVGIVPVGLSAHRQGLPKLKPVDRDIALQTVERYGPDRQQEYRNGEDGFLYLADEFFLLAGVDPPAAYYYDDYPQFENGIGMARSFMDEFEKNKKRLDPDSNPEPIRIDVGKLNVVLVTGKLMRPILEDKIIPEIRKRIKSLDIQALEVENRLLGPMVTVSGLIGGKDIIGSYRKKRLSADARMRTHVLILPPNCINTDGILLDDITPGTIADELGISVHMGSYSMVDTIRELIRRGN